MHGTGQRGAEGWARIDRLSACSFDRYAQLVERELLPKYGAVPHWAKLEVDRMGPEVARQRLAERFPVERFNAARTELDPKNILSNKMLDAALPRD